MEGIQTCRNMRYAMGPFPIRWCPFCEPWVQRLLTLWWVHKMLYITYLFIWWLWCWMILTGSNTIPFSSKSEVRRIFVISPVWDCCSVATGVTAKPWGSAEATAGLRCFEKKHVLFGDSLGSLYIIAWYEYVWIWFNVFMNSVKKPQMSQIYPNFTEADSWRRNWRWHVYHYRTEIMAHRILRIDGYSSY